MSLPAATKSTKLIGADLNKVVTPMLDMTFQLLFFFVLQFRPTSEEGQVDMSLPTDGKNELGAQPLIAEAGPESYTFHVNSLQPADGGPARVKDEPNLRHLRFSSRFESVTFPEDDMLGQMKKKLGSLPRYNSQTGKPPPTIKLQINNRLNYSDVVLLMDLCRQAGNELNIKDIALMNYPRTAP